jgi:hypothetical protein
MDACNRESRYACATLSAPTSKVLFLSTPENRQGRLINRNHRLGPLHDKHMVKQMSSVPKMLTSALYILSITSRNTAASMLINTERRFPVGRKSNVKPLVLLLLTTASQHRHWSVGNRCRRLQAEGRGSSKTRPAAFGHLESQAAKLLRMWSGNQTHFRRNFSWKWIEWMRGSTSYLARFSCGNNAWYVTVSVKPVVLHCFSWSFSLKGFLRSVANIGYTVACIAPFWFGISYSNYLWFHVYFAL